MPNRARQALRSIAAFEAFKGAVVLLAGFGVLRFLGRDAGQLAEQLVHWIHLDPANQYAKLFIQWMASVTDTRLWLYAGFATLYAAVRYIEAYGLWHERRWAEWFAALSGAIYVPFELYELIHKAGWLKFATLVLNLIVVAYMFWLLTEARRRRIKPTPSR